MHEAKPRKPAKPKPQGANDMDFRTKVNSFLKPLTAITKPIELTRSNTMSRYADGAITIRHDLSPERRAELEKRIAALEAERDGTAERAGALYTAEVERATKARDQAINSASNVYDNAVWDLIAEFRQAASTNQSAAPAPAQLTMASVGSAVRRRQPVPVAVETGIPDKIGEVVAERREGAN
jgi:hypothetical protein